MILNTWVRGASGNVSGMAEKTIVIAGRFHGPRNSGNGGYTCGRVAEFIDGPARVRLHVPPPLDVPFEIHRTGEGVQAVYQGDLIAEAWPATGLDLEVPEPPTFAEAERASTRFAGFRSHRFRSCFVCGVDRAPGDGLRLFAGPVDGRDLVACPWVPGAALSDDGQTIRPVFLWSALDCPGGFSFPHPESGTILLGELTAELMAPLAIGEPTVIVGWQVRREGRKHWTGTALFSPDGACHGRAGGLWFEVPELGDR